MNFNIDTKNREDLVNTRPENCVINLAYPIKGRYRLALAQYTNSFFNVCQFNNKVYFIESATPKTATLTPGFYTASTLATEIGTQMTTASGTSTITCTFSSATGKFTFVSNTNAIQFDFLNYTTNPANILLGFGLEQSSSSTTVTSTYVSDISYTKYLNVTINNQNVTYDTKNTTRTFLLPLSGNSLGLTVYEPYNTFPQIVDFQERTNKITLVVRADNGQQIDLNNVDLSMVLYPYNC